MQTIGLLGGMTWRSTLEYYRIINEETFRRLGTSRSAPVVIYSVDFGLLDAMQSEGRWADAACYLSGAAACIERAGADFLLLCANTAHIVAPKIERTVSIPLVHIGDAVAEEIHQRGIVSVGLLGTGFTTGKSFFKDRLASKHHLRVIVPGERKRSTVNRIIYEELCRGKILEGSKNAVLQIMQDLREEGAEGIILGCTELPLLIGQSDTSIPVFDTTRLHAQKAVDLALKQNSSC